MFKVTSCNITLCVTHTKLRELNPIGPWWVSPKQVRLKDMEGCASVVLFFLFCHYLRQVCLHASPYPGV